MCKRPKLKQIKCSIHGCEFMEYTREKEALCAVHYEEMMRSESGILQKPVELRSTTLDRPEIIERMFFVEEGKPMGLTTAEKIQKERFINGLQKPKKKIKPTKGKFKRKDPVQVGEVIGKFKILEVFELAEGSCKRRVKVLCHCGNEFIAMQQNIRQKHTKSCGCLRKGGGRSE